MRPSIRGRPRAAVLAVLVGLAVVPAAPVLPARPVHTATAVLAVSPVPAASPAASGGPAVTLLGQSTWVGTGKVFALRLGVARGLAATDRIVVTAYPRLTSRTDFDQAANGQLGQSSAEWIGQETVAGAPRSQRGGVWARIPVNTEVSPGDLSTAAPFEPGDQSGVYPLRIQVLSAAYATIGTGISTFLVYSANQAGFPKLSASITVPIGAAPVLSSALVPAPVSVASSLSLSTLSAVLAANSGVALSLAVSPQTAEALASGSAVDRVTLRRLAALVRGRDELLVQPYVPVSLARLHASGLDDEIVAQLQEGRSVLTSTLGVTPAASTWVVDEATDDATLQLLGTYGLRRLVVPDAALSPLPACLEVTTYGRPAALADGGGPGLRVVGTDPTLAGRVGPTAEPVLAAEQTLAELAMIQLETPSLVRGVALSLPGGAALSTAYLATLLTGLQRNPFVAPVTAAGLYADVAARAPKSSTCAASSALAPIPVRTLRRTTITPVPAAATLQTLRGQIAGLGLFLPADTALLGRVRRQFLVAPAAALTPSQRNALIGAMAASVRQAESSVHLPGATSVTLTSLKATLPLVVFSNPAQSPHVRLTLDSPKLNFRPFRPGNGTCQVNGSTAAPNGASGPAAGPVNGANSPVNGASGPVNGVNGPINPVNGPTSEVCYLVLHGPQTALRVPVEARTSGVFSLDVVVTSPDGSLTLATARDTVRSTAVSFVGIVIIIVSLLFLGIWWIRDIRSGRRARQLVRRPGDDPGDEEMGDGGDGGDDGEEPPGSGVGPQPPAHPGDPTEALRPRHMARPLPSAAGPAVPVRAGPVTLST